MIAPVLVTGATGNVGRAVVASLGALDVPFVTTRLDLRDPSTFDAALRGVRGLFLLRPPAISDVGPTLNALVDRALAMGVAHVTFLSVEGADRQTWVPHHRVEAHLAARGVSRTILRPGFFAQNFGDAYRRDVVEDDRLYVSAGAGRVAFVDVRDVGELAARSFVDASLRGVALTLTGPTAVTFHEAAAMLSEVLGRAIRYEPASVVGYARHLLRRGMPLAQVAVQTVLHTGLRFGNAERVDPTLAERLGHAPRDLRAYFTDHRALWAKAG